MSEKYQAQVPASFYDKRPFDAIRIESATEQLRQIIYSGDMNILEIGVGKGFLRHCLKFFPEITHTTVDIAEDLDPDYIASVTHLPFEDHQFDLVVCGQVLEHLRFEDFLPALKEIRRVTGHTVIISLPDRTRHFGIAFCLARFGWYRFEWNQTRRCYSSKEFEFDGQHYWEIGCKGTLDRDVIRTIKTAGLTIKKQYRLWDHPWHRFFILGV